MVYKTMVWYPYFKPWKPAMVWDERVIFPVGDYSKPTSFRQMVDNIHMLSKDKHKYILVHEDPDVFYDLPINSVPILHVSSRLELKEKENKFLENIENHPLKGLSFFCGKESFRSERLWSIVLVRGYNYTNMDNTVQILKRQRNPVYVYSYQNRTILSEIPEKFRIRELKGLQ